jgi:hypothetical protein
MQKVTVNIMYADSPSSPSALIACWAQPAWLKDAMGQDQGCESARVLEQCMSCR